MTPKTQLSRTNAMRVILPLTIVLACGASPDGGLDESDTTSSSEVGSSSESVTEATTDGPDTGTNSDATDATDTADTTDPTDTSDATDTSDTADGTDTNTSTTGDGDYDCDNLPSPTLTELDGPIGAADLAFDAQGNLVGSNTMALFKTANGASAEVFVPGLSGRAATRYLPNGDLVFVQEQLSQALLVHPDASTEVLAGNLNDPFGAASDLEGMVYIADGNRVLKIDPSNGDQEVFIGSVPDRARWLSFDLNYDGIFVGGESDTIWRAPIDAAGAGALVEWGTIPVDDAGGIGSIGAYIDGIGVDACGNVYVAEVATDALYKIGPEGGVGEVFVDWGFDDYGHGIEWGSGIGGWDSMSIYMPQPYDDHTVVQVDIGVPSKAKPYP